MSETVNEQEKIIEKALLIGASLGSGKLNDTDEASMNELAELVKAADAEPCAIMIQNIKSVDPRTFIGKGKVEEAAEFIRNNEISMVIFDQELSGSVTKNLENELGVRVIDRSRLILDIFAKRATTKEGKCQVELAQLRYILPRLSGIGADLSRQGGGIGTRGPGETKLETDRRHIQKKIEYLTDELKEIEKHRFNIRRKRQADDIPQIAVVGYTNAGKSSLINLLTGDNDAYVENMLFATLDPLIRKFKLNDKTEVLISDTVGFVRKLPHHLVEAFKSTLEEVKYADIILHLIDSSSDDVGNAVEVVDGILKELNTEDKPVLKVFNKCDLKMPPRELEDNDSVVISVKEEININKLTDKLQELILSSKHNVTVIIPYSEGNILGYIYKSATVISETPKEDGYLMEISADEECFNKIKKWIVQGE